MDTNTSKSYTRKIVQTGLFISLALVVRTFSYMVYIGGAPGMRVGFSGVFIKLPALLFGPLYGGIAGGLLDILGYLIKPEGAFIPLLTLTAILGGIITGYLWRIVKDIETKKFQKCIFFVFILILLVGIINHITASYFSNTYWAHVINSIGKNKDFLTIGLEAASLLGIGLMVIDLIIKKINTKITIYQNYLKLIIVTGISGLIVTTLNTYILQLFVPGLGKIAFLVFWIPRIIQEIIMTVLQAYIVSFLLSIYNKVQAN